MSTNEMINRKNKMLKYFEDLRNTTNTTNTTIKFSEQKLKERMQDNFDIITTSLEKSTFEEAEKYFIDNYDADEFKKNIIKKIEQTDYGKVVKIYLNNDIEKTSELNTKLKKMIELTNEFPDIINSKLKNKLRVADILNKPRTTENIYEGLGMIMLNGGSVTSIVGEFEAFKNTTYVEKNNVNMVGGDNEWAPLIEINNLDKAVELQNTVNSIVKKLDEFGKSLSKADLDAFNDAINLLGSLERTLSGMVAYYKEYILLLTKFKDTTDPDIKTHIENMNMDKFVHTYYRKKKKVEKKEKKIMIAIDALLVQTGLLLGSNRF